MGDPLYREGAVVASDLIPCDPPTRAPGPLEVLLRIDDRTVIVVLDGEVDISSVGTLRACLDHVLADSYESVVIDLAGVTFLDSSGLAVVARAHVSLQEMGRHLRLSNPSPSVRRVLELSGLDALLP